MKRMTNEEITSALIMLGACTRAINSVECVGKGGSEPWRQHENGTDLLWVCIRVGLWRKAKPVIRKLLHPDAKVDNDYAMTYIDSYFRKGKRCVAANWADDLVFTISRKSVARAIRRKLSWGVIQGALLKEVKNC